MYQIIYVLDVCIHFLLQTHLSKATYKVQALKDTPGMVDGLEVWAGI